MTRFHVPLAVRESRIWAAGMAIAVLSAAAIAFSDRIGVPLWLIGMAVFGSVIGVTLLAALAIRRAHDYQIRLQDEAESLRGRFKQWSDWLSQTNTAARAADAAALSPAVAAAARALGAAAQALDASGPALTPETLVTFSLMSDEIRMLTVRLQQDRAEANAVLGNLDGGVIALDRQSRITLINTAAKTFFQIKRPCLGLTLIEVIRQPEIVESVQRVLRDQSSQEVSLEILSDEDRRRSLRVRCSRLRYGETAGVLIAAHDESETRRIEEVRREFVANVSHELKTPLAAIKGYAETVELAIGDDPEAAKHFVSQIQEQCKRLESLIADMMTLARAQAGTQHLRPTTVDLNGIVAESIKTYAPVAAARRVFLSQTPSPLNPVIVHADREATLTIANNVVGNAIRYTPEGGTVVASCRIEATFGVLSVQDNGIGIPENEQKRIFERFYRVDKSRMHASSGTGLGLSIVKNLTQAQRGEVRLRSRQGEGSTFEIFLPSQPAAESEPVSSRGELPPTSPLVTRGFAEKT